MIKVNRNKKLISVLFIVSVAIIVCFSATSCRDKTYVNDEETYKNHKLNKSLSMSWDIDAFYDKLDYQYGHDLSLDLATNPNIADFSLWRTAGSDGEHLAADYLVNKMAEIGLQNIEKKGLPCDKFQFNYSRLRIAGTDIDITPGTYHQQGTNGTLTTQIVDCGTGFEQDYANVNVYNKIALVKVDLYNIAWVDCYIRQAKKAGAVALVTWSDSGYAQGNPAGVNVQDDCCENIMPACAVSANDAKRIIDSISNGSNNCMLNLETELYPNQGLTYNVMGMIPGKSHDGHIVLAGHYDKYWEGFQDDSCAIGLIFTVAKAMIESGYQPENDIYIICHGAEEWGVSGSQFDWATGSWAFANSNQDFCDTTLAMFNCELPAFERKDGIDLAMDYELQTIMEEICAHQLLVTSGDVKFNKVNNRLSTYEDGISYKTHGVPHFYDYLTKEPWLNETYHTAGDNNKTFDSDTFNSLVNFYGACAIYIDKIPALKLDFEQTVDVLENQLDEETLKQAGVNVDQYHEALDGLRSAASDLNEQIDICNKKYERAYKNDDKDQMSQARAEGKELNRKTHEAFKMIQNGIFKVADGYVYYGHIYADECLSSLDQTLYYLDKGDIVGNEKETGAATTLGWLNCEHEYYYLYFSPEIARRSIIMYSSEYYQKDRLSQWATGRTDSIIDVEAAALQIFNATTINDIKDLNSVKSILQNGKSQCFSLLAKNCNDEINTLKNIVKYLNG